MDTFDEKSSSYLSGKRYFAEFLDSPDTDYGQRVKDMIRSGETRLIVNLNHIRANSEDMARQILEKPMAYFAPFQAALRDYIRLLPSDSFGQEANKFNPEANFSIGLEGSFGSNRVSPRQLSARHLGQLVCVEGIVTRASIVRPKLMKSVQFCPATLKHSEMEFHDATSLSGFPTSTIQPQNDLEGNPVVQEYGLSKYDDHQSLTIQEMPERAPAGLLPSSVDCVADGDLVDRCKPGDRVQIIGIYRALPSAANGSTSGLFRSVLIVNNIKPITKSSTGIHTGPTQITAEDLKNIRKIAKRPDLFHLLSRSIAPSIQGHDVIKQAMVMLLLGGVEKNLENGTHIRGDINMLMVGDPSTAKSQLLRFVLNIAPLAINTTGRGSSGVGLTAAVTTDKDTGERRLEAGAMVLADRGVVCIDEFDKMSDADRVAIHEVMEQQTVTIAKAGIHMSLNARCSVVAAANPRYSQYDTSRTPSFNVNLPDSLLSRFDFLFIILDTPDPELDRAISDKVLNNHRFVLSNNEADMEDDEAAEDEANNGATPVYQKFDRFLHAGLTSAARGKKVEILTIGFMKKYLEFAKTHEPLLTEEAAAFVGDAYAKLRQDNAGRRESSHPITARALETLIRLSTAHAKAHLREEVSVHDCEVALQIMKYAVEGTEMVRRAEDERVEKEKQKDEQNKNRRERSKQAEDEYDEAERALEEEREERERGIAQADARGSESPAKRKARAPVQAQEESQEADESQSPKRARAAAPVSGSSSVDPERRRVFSRFVVNHMRRLYECEFSDLARAVNTEAGREGVTSFSDAEMRAILRAMEDDNQVMFANEVIHRI